MILTPKTLILLYCLTHASQCSAVVNGRAGPEPSCICLYLKSLICKSILLYIFGLLAVSWSMFIRFVWKIKIFIEPRKFLRNQGSTLKSGRKKSWVESLEQEVLDLTGESSAVKLKQKQKLIRSPMMDRTNFLNDEFWSQLSVEGSNTLRICRNCNLYFCKCWRNYFYL